MIGKAVCALGLWALAFQAPAETLYREGADPFGAKRSFKVGDTLTVLVVENFSSQREAENSASKSSTLGGGASVAGSGSMSSMPTFGLNGSTNIGNSSKGQGLSRRSDQLNSTITVRVVKVLEGGVLQLSGSRSTQVDGETQALSLSGTVRPEDVSWDNTVSSLRLADAWVSYKAGGAAQEAAQEGWLSRVWGYLRLW